MGWELFRPSRAPKHNNIKSLIYILYLYIYLSLYLYLYISIYIYIIYNSLRNIWISIPYYRNRFSLIHMKTAELKSRGWPRHWDHSKFAQFTSNINSPTQDRIFENYKGFFQGGDLHKKTLKMPKHYLFLLRFHESDKHFRMGFKPPSLPAYGFGLASRLLALCLGSFQHWEIGPPKGWFAESPVDSHKFYV